MDKKTYKILAEFFDDLTKEELIHELIHLLKYESVVSILKELEHDAQRTTHEKERA